MDSESPNDPIDTEDPIEVAELAEEPDAVEASRYTQPDEATQKFEQTSHQLPPQFQNVAAKGGAVGALVLGCLAVFGAFVTQWSLFNAVLGLILGLWGLSSNMPRLAFAGILLCGIGLVLCLTVPSMF